MKNEYDALNKAWMDLDGLDDAPLSSAELGSLKKRLGREGMPFPTRAPGRGMLALGLAAALTAGLFTAGAAGRLDWGQALTQALGMDQARAEELGLPGGEPGPHRDGRLLLHHSGRSDRLRPGLLFPLYGHRPGRRRPKSDPVP